MSDRTCIKCNTKFRYPSTLKTHLEKSSRCAISSEEINIFFSSFDSNVQPNVQPNVQQIVQPIIEPIVEPILEPTLEPILEPTLEPNVQRQNSNNIKINKFNCNTCNKLFTRKSSLLRHQREISCFNKNETTTLNPTENINSNQIPNQIQNQIYNTNNQNTINSNNTINNTIINNNTTIIQHINPFGFEDVRTISIPEMKKILSSGENSGLQIIKAIYNKIENKNFYKPNMSRPEIACLNTDFNLTIYKCKEFCDALFDRCITFLHHMLYLCKNEYSKNAIKKIYDNIEFIETTMRTEIYDKKLQNIVESEFRNNNVDNKDRIKKFIKEIKDKSESKEQSKSLLNNVLSFNNDSKKEYKVSINDEELNKVFGDPKVIIGLNKQEFIDEFHNKYFEDTKFYKFWRDRIKNEITYINKSKTATIGDIKTINYRTTKIELMLNVIKARSELLKRGDLIDLDVEGFIYEKIDDDIVA
jgi:hypothetical protein